MTRWVEGSVSILRCEAGRHSTPHLIFSGDTDMVTAGLAALSSVTRDEIVVAELEPSEFSDETGRSFQRRINDLLGRDDLHFITLLRVEECAGLEALSFQAFRKAYTPPRLVFACPRCEVGEAISVKIERPSDFERSGGQITVLGAVEVRD